MHVIIESGRTAESRAFDFFTSRRRIIDFGEGRRTVERRETRRAKRVSRFALFFFFYLYSY